VLGFRARSLNRPKNELHWDVEWRILYPPAAWTVAWALQEKGPGLAGFVTRLTGQWKEAASCRPLPRVRAARDPDGANVYQGPQADFSCSILNSAVRVADHTLRAGDAERQRVRRNAAKLTGQTAFRASVITRDITSDGQPCAQGLSGNF